MAQRYFERLIATRFSAWVAKSKAALAKIEVEEVPFG
jgi:hypothetical protein